MLVVERNERFINWSIGSPVRPLNYFGEVVIAFDPSKTNMAMVVGTPDNQILDCIEFSGNNRKKGPAMDTSLYCQEVRQYLSTYLANVQLYCVGVEQALNYKGMDYYHSNMVLTEIRSNLLNFFLEQFNISVIEVANWSWKFSILPDGYRGKYEKGSKKWFLKNEPDSPYAQYYEADMTDCLCIYWYLIKEKCSTYNLYCNRVEPKQADFNYYFRSLEIQDAVRKVLYNPRFPLEANQIYYANRLACNFGMEIPVDIIEIPKIYGHSVGFDSRVLRSNNIEVVTMRC